VTLAGPSNAIWIFQIAQNLTLGSGAKVLLSGGAKAGNIFWQVGGGAGAEIGTTAHVEGTILAKTAIHLRTGASLNGRALAQTAVTLEKNTLVIPLSSTTQTFTSNPTLDGWVLESSRASNIGGSMNSTATTFNLGDDAANRQYRAILHFDTSSLPDMAIITSVTLRINEQGLVGKNPFSAFGGLQVGIRKPFFGTTASLQISDFQAVANASGVAIFGTIPVSNWYSANLNATGRSFVNVTGTTQIRLRFTTYTNNNNVADYMKFYSGNAAAALRPQLVIKYSMP
jgi:hypothetical protein